LLVVAAESGNAVQVWNVRNFRHPVLDATITPSQPAQSIWFLSGSLLGTVGPATAGNAYMQLWGLANPSRPADDGPLEVGIDDMTYMPSSKLLTTGATAGTSASASSIWNLANPRHVQPPESAFDANPNALTWVNGQVMGGAKGDDSAIALWSTSDLQRPLTAFPIGGGNQVNTMLVSPDSTLLGAGLSNVTGDNGEEVELWTIPANDRSLAEFAQLPADSNSAAFAPDSGADRGALATNISTIGQGQLAAFTPYELPAIVYPLAADDVYKQLCADTEGTPGSEIQSWEQYLPTTFYRLGC
jgi:WD40 repeat protein